MRVVCIHTCVKAWVCEGELVQELQNLLGLVLELGHDGRLGTEV